VKKRLVRLIALALVAGAIGVMSAYVTFDHAQRSVVIGAHSTTVTPTFDGYATIDFGPVLPRMRLPLDKPLGIGVNIDVGDSEVGSIEQLIAQDAVIASQPEGEIAKVGETVNGMARDAVLRGMGATALAVIFLVLAWRAVGEERRQSLLIRRPRGRELAIVGATGAMTIAAAVLIAVPERPSESAPEPQWVNLTSVFSNIPTDPTLDRVEIAQGGASKTGNAIVEGAIETYQTSVRFYGKLQQRAASVQVRKPDGGQKTAVVVTDRHDNVGMDPVVREIARGAEAKILFDLGDDTSTGGTWEEFSINSLARAFEGFDVVAIAGNHDTGPNVLEAMKSNGFMVLDGKPLDVEGIRFLGASDPRSSGLTAGYSGNESDSIAAVGEQDEKITTTACDDGRVSTLLMHSSASAAKASASGCVDLVLTGHLHRQVGPDLVISPEGRRTVSFSNASTGGAVYAFALGSKLRRPAQVTIVTYEDGKPVGLQPVDFETSGSVEVQPYVDFATLEPEPVPAL